MYEIRRSGAFKKDIKIMLKRKKNIEKIKFVITQLESGTLLASKFKDHKLVGNWYNHRECHIEPDWLLIYRVNGMVLELVRTGTHSDLFNK